MVTDKVKREFRDNLARQASRLAECLEDYPYRETTDRLLLVCDHLMAIQQILDLRLTIIASFSEGRV